MSSMTMRHYLTVLKSAQLKHLAFLTGLNSTGTKAQLVATLSSELSIPRLDSYNRPTPVAKGSEHAGTQGKGTNYRSGPRGARILSIDMGIRNLAYCVLDMPDGIGVLQHSGRCGLDGRQTTVARSNSSNIVSHLRLSAWNRVVVNEESSTISAAATSPADDADVPETTTAPHLGPTSPQDALQSIITSPTRTIAFEPATYAKLAYNLMTHLLTTHKPTTILIERQRWRSGGASTVLEWTIRVNMFEGMLHAVLETLRREHAALSGPKEGGFPSVYSVSPKRVFDFCSEQTEGANAALSSDAAEKVARKVVPSKAKAQKALKISIVERWLRLGSSDTSDPVIGSACKLKCTEDIIPVRDAFLDKLSKQKGRASGHSKDVHGRKSKNSDNTEGMGKDTSKATSAVTAVVEKLDDLADCVLQGVTWVQWEANRYAVLESVDVRNDVATAEDIANESNKQEAGDGDIKVMKKTKKAASDKATV